MASAIANRVSLSWGFSFRAFLKIGRDSLKCFALYIDRPKGVVMPVASGFIVYAFLKQGIAFSKSLFA
jgi:hypothetical protein